MSGQTFADMSDFQLGDALIKQSSSTTGSQSSISQQVLDKLDNLSNKFNPELLTSQANMSPEAKSILQTGKYYYDLTVALNLTSSFTQIANSLITKN